MNFELDWKWNVPEGESGDARITHFTIDRHAYMMQLMGSGPKVPEGTYCRLHVGKKFMMSNTPWERSTNCQFLTHAKGDVLILGLGLGYVVRELLREEHNAISFITVLENSKGVIDLVSPYVDHPKVEVVYTDAFTFKPVMKYDSIWADIWDTPGPEQTTERRKLIGRYRKYKNPGGWMKTWSQSDTRWGW